MPPFFSRHGGSREPLLRRLERAAELINPFLIVIAIGLAILDAACLIAIIDWERLAPPAVNASPAISTPTSGRVLN